MDGYRRQVAVDLDADGSSFDCHERDALHYHLYTLQPLLTLALAARRNGIGGVVIDGACRDIAESAEHGFPVFGRAVVPVSARGRIVQLAMDEPVEFAGITVHPGDVVFADQNGVVFIPAAELDRVVALAERIVARESAMAEAVLAGNPVTEVMHDSKFPTIEETQ